MRLGVLDIGSNTVHLLVADARPGGRPLATTSQRTVLRLMRYLGPDGSITDEGVKALVDAVSEARKVALAEDVDELLATATSAVREATNGPEVIALIEEALGQELQVLGGESEARFTFLAVRRWYLTLASLFVLALLLTLLTAKPALAIGLAAAPLLYVVWANGRYSLRPVLPAAEEAATTA